MGRYINWDDVTLRYPEVETRNAGAAAVGSAYIQYAEAAIDGMLASHFTTPFSSNNLTAKDLSVELVYARIIRKADKEAAAMAAAGVSSMVTMLKNGSLGMVTTSGDIIANNGTGDEIWSTTQNYHSIFGVNDPKLSPIDSSQIYDEESERGLI